tara:strand:- start:2363 stop:2701 length:339 start_codon:yes stop_codon:yes gene_type:complete
MKKKILLNIVKNYFKFFQSKDIFKLEDLFSKRIVLEDWNNFKKGKNSVINFNKNLFKKFKNIKISLKKIVFINDFKLICFISIKLDKQKLKVIDILEFNRKLKIKKIEAYLG